MALNKSTLEGDILKIMDALVKETKDPAAARRKFAKDLATAVDTFVKSAQVNSNIPVQVNTGTGTGATTATGTLS